MARYILQYILVRNTRRSNIKEISKILTVKEYSFLKIINGGKLWLLKTSAKIKTPKFEIIYEGYIKL